ncbi:MAG: S8 family serine peptidase [Planctomycetota bacterium]
MSRPTIAAFLAGIIGVLTVLCPAGQVEAQNLTTAVDTAVDGPVHETLDASATLTGLDQARLRHPNITGSGYTVAVIDTGIAADHPALTGRYVGGYDFVNDDNDPTDDNGHGTHVTGTAVSSDADHPGMAPEAGYASLKVLDSEGSGTFSDIEKALQWVADNRDAHNIVAVNMSFGTNDTYNTSVTSMISDELATLESRGVFISAAAGNQWYDNQPDEGVSYPSADGSAVAVGSVWTDDFGGVAWNSGAEDHSTAPDRVVSHSDRSTAMLDVLAPGTFITSTAHDWESGADFVSMSGTSMATPSVAGFAVLLREAIEENWDPADWPEDDQWQDTILGIMQDSAVMVYDGDDEDDNVTNLDEIITEEDDYKLYRIDVAAALDATVPEPGCIALLAMGSVVLMKRRRR